MTGSASVFSLALSVLAMQDAGAGARVQISDFVALGAPGQIDPDADMRSRDGLLNLFVPDMVPPPGLTRRDQAFLGGLYATEQNLPTTRGNEVAVARETLRALSESRD